MQTANQVIAVIGATGLQGGGVVRALRQQCDRFRVRALTRNPGAKPALADEVIRADLSDPATLRAAFDGAYGVFVVTNFWEKGGVDEVAQATAAVNAAKDAGVEHFIWSTLPNVADISGGKLRVPHFTAKARVDAVVRAAGFRYTTFVEAPFYYQNFLGQLAPQPLADGTRGWMLPIRQDARCIHMGDITELGNVVAGAFLNPRRVGSGQHLSLSGGLLSFGDVVATLNQQGHRLVFKQIPGEVFAAFFPGAAELAATFQYFEQYTYMGPNADEKIALAREVTTAPMTDFAAWAKLNLPAATGSL